MSAINKTHFQGVSGYIRFDGSDRSGPFTIQQFFVNETVTVGSYVPRPNGEGGGLKLNHDLIKWLSPLGSGVHSVDSGMYHLLAVCLPWDRAFIALTRVCRYCTSWLSLFFFYSVCLVKKAFIFKKATSAF